MDFVPDVKSWMDEFPLVAAPAGNPVRGHVAGMGDEFLVKLVPPNTPGALTQFLSRGGTWVNFASTELNAWGSLIGDIQNQADLWAELQARPLTTDLAPVAFSGAYNDLTGKPVLGDLAFINTNGLTSYFLRGDGTWQIPVDVNAVWGNIGGDINAQTDLKSALDLKAPLASPVFTGNPRAPTPPVDDNTDRLGTTAWFFGQAFDGSPVMDGTASSGDSTRWARGNHRHPTDTSRAPLDSPNFLGLPTAPTPPTGNSTERLATTAFVLAQIAATPPSGITDAPMDGRFYVRSNGAWVAVDLGTKWDNDGLMDGVAFDAGFSDGFGG